MGNIINITDREGNIVLPVTSTKAVFDEEGNSIESILNTKVLLKSQQLLTLTEKEDVKGNILDKTYSVGTSTGMGKKHLKMNIGNLGLPFNRFVNSVSVELTALNETPAEIVWDSDEAVFLASDTIGTEVNKKYYGTWLHDDGYKNLVAGRRFYTYDGTHAVYYEYFSGTLNPVQNTIEANILTQDMLYKGEAGSRVPNTNTIFVIQDDFNLNNDVIVVPEGCVLEFDGGSLKVGSLVLNGTVIIANKPCFNNVITTGTCNNPCVYASWYGLLPNDSTINCTPVVKDCIVPLNKPIVFFEGSYYFSEYLVYNNKSDKFIIIGEKSVNAGLGYKTTFKPFYSNQRYIIKVGGSADYYGQNTPTESSKCGYNIVIDGIHFSNNSDFDPESISNLLVSKYNTPNTESYYGCSLLILDRIEIGRFSFSGKPYNAPLATFGYIYEVEFDKIIMYGNEGKSDLPIIQVINDAGHPISAMKVNDIMFEVCVGPLIYFAKNSSTAELTVNNFFYENSVGWSSSANSKEVRYGSPIDYSQYDCVPMFIFNGSGNICIANLIVNGVCSYWWNQNDHPGETWDSEHPVYDKTRSFLTGVPNYDPTIRINKIINAGAAYYLYSDIGNSNYYPRIYVGFISSIEFLFKNDTNAFIKVDTDSKGSTLITPQSDFEYTGLSLLDIFSNNFVANRGEVTSFKYKNNEYFIHTDYGANIVSGTGIKLPAGTKWIDVFSRASYEGYDNLTMEYHLVGGSTVTETIALNSYKGSLWANYVRQHIIQITQTNIDYVVIKRASVSSDLLSVIFRTEQNPPFIKTGYTVRKYIENTRTVSGFIDNVYNGYSLVGKDVNTLSVSVSAHSTDYYILRLCLYKRNNLLFVNGGSHSNGVCYLVKTIQTRNSYTIGSNVEIYSFGTNMQDVAISYYKKPGNANDLNYLELKLPYIANVTDSPKIINLVPESIITAEALADTAYDDTTYAGRTEVPIGDLSQILLKKSGAFSEKPSSSAAPVGYNYFCTDKQTSEGAINGIEIFHKGSGVWVDALGRVVS